MLQLEDRRNFCWASMKALYGASSGERHDVCGWVHYDGADLFTFAHPLSPFSVPAPQYEMHIFVTAARHA